MPAVPEALKEGLFKALNSYSLPTFILLEEATPTVLRASHILGIFSQQRAGSRHSTPHSGSKFLVLSSVKMGLIVSTLGCFIA